jgi:hypothetical protein
MFIKLKPWIVIVLLIVAVIVSLFIFVSWKSQSLIDGFECIQSELNNSAGFYSALFFTMNHYLYCKKHKINFEIKSDHWLFKSKDGWTDYFEPISLNYYEECTNKKEYSHGNVIEEYPIINYQNVIKEIYVYNQRTKLKINETIHQLGLRIGEYDSIFIRRGDKLGQESKLLGEIEYFNLLLSKNPKCHTLFLQTDDYNCFKTFQNHIDTNKLNIKLLTLCDENSVGVIVHNHQKTVLNSAVQTNENEENKKYLSENIDKMNATKTVEDMNPTEKYKHTIDMIVGIDLCLHSNICVTDYQSNVARFIKLAHSKPINVYNILHPDKDIDYNHLICPAYGF